MFIGTKLPQLLTVKNCLSGCHEKVALVGLEYELVEAGVKICVGTITDESDLIAKYNAELL